MLAACAPNPNGGGVADFQTVVGRVVDAKTQQPIQQYTVSIGGQSVSVSPAAKGAFTINRVPIGTNTLTIFSIGYQTYSQTVLVPKDAPLDVGLIGIVAIGP